jgi:hypothetical protein
MALAGLGGAAHASDLTVAAVQETQIAAINPSAQFLATVDATPLETKLPGDAASDEAELLAETKDKAKPVRSSTYYPIARGKLALESASQSDAARSSFKLTAERRDNQSGGEKSIRDRYKTSLALQGTTRLTPDVTMKFGGEFTDHYRSRGEVIGGLLLNDTDEWQQKTVGVFDFSLGFLNDSLRVSTKQQRSSFMRTDDGERGRIAGSASRHKVSLRVLNTERTKLTLFGLKNTVDAFYEPMSGGSDGKDALKVNNRVTIETGASLNIGSVIVNFSQRSAHAIDREVSDSNFSGMNESEGTLSYALPREKWIANAPRAAFLTKLLPNSAWAKIKTGEIQNALLDQSWDVTTEEISIGANWSWDGGSGDVSYWRSTFDSQQPFNETADWTGNGLDASIQFYKKNWSIYLGASVYNAQNLEEWNQSSELNFGGSVALSYTPKDLPDLKAGFTIDKYKADYFDYDGSSENDYWQAQLEADFSKYFKKDKNRYQKDLRVVAQVRQLGSSSRWSDYKDRSDQTEMFIGMRFSVQMAH